MEDNLHPCVRLNSSKSWEDQADGLMWHWASSGIGSSSVLPKSARRDAGLADD
jgi:hypothetical protein